MGTICDRSHISQILHETRCPRSVCWVQLQWAISCISTRWSLRTTTALIKLYSWSPTVTMGYNSFHSSTPSVPMKGRGIPIGLGSIYIIKSPSVHIGLGSSHSKTTTVPIGLRSIYISFHSTTPFAPIGLRSIYISSYSTTPIAPIALGTFNTKASFAPIGPSIIYIIFYSRTPFAPIGLSTFNIKSPFAPIALSTFNIKSPFASIGSSSDLQKPQRKKQKSLQHGGFQSGPPPQY
jgi:hypothetical protein